MSIGHGTPGLLDRLRDFAGLMDSLVMDSAAAPRPYLELQLGLSLEATTWDLHSGFIWVSRDPISTLYGGRVRDVVGVETMIFPRALTRVESIASMVAGTYFCDIDTASGGAVDVYVWLPDSTYPGDTTVVALLLFTFGVQGAVHPWLGPDKLVDGALDLWDSSTNLTHWTDVMTAGWSADQRDAIAPRGTYAMKLTGASGSSGSNGFVRPDTGVPVVGGKWYRCAGYYRTGTIGDADTALPANCYAGLLISGFTDATYTVLRDGRTYAATNVANTVVLAETNGQARRFLFDFIAKSDWIDLNLRLLAWNNTGGAVSREIKVRFDEVTLRRIYRWSFYEPRLSANGLPATEVMSQSLIFSGKTMTIGSVSIINGDGDLEEAMGALLKHHRSAQIFGAGFFADGQEVYRDNWHGRCAGLTRNPDAGDDRFGFDLEDARTLARFKIPARRYGLAEFPTMDLNAEGKGQQLLFGDTRAYNIKPVRTGLTSDGYGTYQILDAEIPTADNVAVISSGTMRIYPNEEMADKDENGYDISDTVFQYAFNGLFTVWTVVADIRNYRFDRGGNDVGTHSIFDFNIGGGQLHASIDVYGPAYVVASVLEGAMNAAAGVANITVVFNETTHKFTVARGSGTLQLLPQTGTNAHKQSWKILGFDTGVNRTGALSYVGNEATFESPEVDHILRFTSGGYKDDAAGSICGAANAALDTAPAAASWIVQKVCKIPAAMVNLPSFSAARVALAAEDSKIRLYIQDERDVTDVIAELEVAGLMDVVIDGDGVWHCVRNPSTISRYFYDRDFLSWHMKEMTDQIYKTVRAMYGYHPAQGRFLKSTEQASDAGIPVKYGSDRVLELQSHFDDDGGAIAAAAAVLAQRVSNFSYRVPRIAEFHAAGKLTDLLIGQKISLTRARAGLGGPLSNATFRIMGLGQDDMTGIGFCVAAEAIEYETPP